ncbi:MAG: hypothetical protein JWN30_2212 [Bacilli bacterium]|nr:hypothetical protein [Bacilli bacterium]
MTDHTNPLVPSKVSRDKTKRLAVIIPAMNEEDTLGPVLDEISRLDPDRIIVVVNGSTDNTASIARDKGAEVLEFADPLGNDIGRSVGAMHVDADIYLFTDADIVLPAEDVLPLIVSIEKGTALALNSLDWLSRYPEPDEPSIDRYFSNLVQGRRNLGVENALTVPHAFSGNGLNVIGKDALADPLLATCLAIDKGLAIDVPTRINVLDINKDRYSHLKRDNEKMSEAYQRMHGDSIEGLHYLLATAGKRAGFRRGNQKRRVFAKACSLQSFSSVSTRPLSIVLSVTRHSNYLTQLLKDISTLDIEIQAVLHDGTDIERNILTTYAIPFVEFKKYVGHEVAFAIGSMNATGRILIFHDTNIPIDAEDLEPFILQMKLGEHDISINNHNRYQGKLEGMQAAHIGNWFMNITASRNDLGTSSMLLPPYGITREALALIGPECLMSPSLAQMRAIDLGLRVGLSGSVDYIGRIKTELYSVVFDEDRILGNLMEGLYYWTQRYGYRGGFTDMKRTREVIPMEKVRYYSTAQPKTLASNEIRLDWLLSDPIFNTGFDADFTLSKYYRLFYGLDDLDE